MKIVKHKIKNLVKYVFNDTDDILLTDKLVSPNMIDNYVNSIDYEIIENIVLPDNFKLGYFIYTDKFVQIKFDDQKLALKTLHDIFQKFIDKIRFKYSNYELNTFQSQEDEWRAWKKDNAVSTPIIDAIALGRNIDRIELLNKIENNILKIYTILGLQQKYEDEINSKNFNDEFQIIFKNAEEELNNI